MMDNQQLRSIILKLESRLSDDDRERLHFFLGNDVPRRIRDDASLRGTLRLMESLFDQDKINEHDFTLLIHAFEEIQCMDAANLLKEHKREMQSQSMYRSIQSLASIMPITIEQSIEVQELDKYAIQKPLINLSDEVNNVGIIAFQNETVDNHSLKSTQKNIPNRSLIKLKSVFLCTLILSISGLASLTSLIIYRTHHFQNELQKKEKRIDEEQTKHNRTLQQLHFFQSTDNYTILNLTNQVNQSSEKHREQTETIYRLMNLQSSANYTIRNLNSQLNQSQEKQQEQTETIHQFKNLQLIANNTILNLTNQVKELLNKQEEQMNSINELTHLRSMDNQTIQYRTQKLQQSMDEQKILNRKIEELTNQVQQLTREQTENSKTKQKLLNDIGELNRKIQDLQNIREENERKIKELMNNLNRTSATTLKTDQIPVTTIGKTASIRPSRIYSQMHWKQNGVSVANSDSKSSLHPWSFEIEDDENLVIADYSNHRILLWNIETQEKQIIAGGNELGSRLNQLNYPTDVVIDKRNDTLIICDRVNQRVIQWNRDNGRQGVKTILNIKCFGVAIDHEGLLYVSDLEKHQIKRLRIGTSDSQEIVVAGGNGRGHRLDQLNTPHFIYVDNEQSIFISDTKNHRIVKWVKNATEGIVVAGGQGDGPNLRQLGIPEGIFVDSVGTIFIADCTNHRIVAWIQGAAQGYRVVGDSIKGKESNQLDCPMDLSFDTHGNLYVADYYNNRIQKFHVI